MATLSIIAQPGKTAPTPYGPLAFAYSVAGAATAPKVTFVHSLPADAQATQLDINGQTIVGQSQVLSALANEFKTEGAYGQTQNDTAQITALLLLIPSHPPAFPTATLFLSQLEQKLTLRTFLVGHSLSMADWAIWGAIRANTVAQGLLKNLVHVARWYYHISALPAATKAVEDIATQSKIKAPKAAKGGDDAAAAAAPSANATFDLGLPNAIKGQVVTRLPPEPSGYLHIGHAKAAILNQFFARMYEGKFLIRFDDTNPSKEKAEFEESIIEDLALLGVKADATSYTSDYFDQLHIFCVKMIKDGFAYADDTAQEKMRDERMNGIPSERRELSVEDSLAHFAEMATGSEEGAKWCIRAKISFDDPNKAMRDPVIYRCNALPHHRTGNKYKMYPTYDFCCPIVDSIEGVTHALRTNEYRDRNPQYQWMLDAAGLRKVDVWDFGRLAFVYTLLSKRKLKWFVEEGHVAGWDDPRFATVRGIRRRGMTIEAITQFMLLQGPSQAFTNLEWDVIWNINKKVIDPVAARHTALESEGLVKVTLSGEGLPAGDGEAREMAKHKKNPEVGTKQTNYASVIYLEQEDAKGLTVGEEITLMDWGNAIVRSVTGGNGSPVTALEMDLNLSGDFKKTKKKVTWLASIPSAPLVDVELVDYDYLIFKKKLEEDDNVADFLTPTTEFVVKAQADPSVGLIKKGDIIQFERKGFYILDREAGPEGPARLILIPDGKASSVAVKYVDPKIAAKAAEEEKKAAEKKAGKKAAKSGGAAAGGEAKKEKKKVAAPAVAAAAKGGRIPEPAPVESVETTLLSDGKTGFEQKVLTKMFRVPSIYGEDGYDAPATTSMFKVKPVYEL